MAQAGEDRYDLVHGCYGVRAVSDGDYLAKAGNGYTALADTLDGAEPFRMQATDLGKYLLFGEAEDFLAISQADPLPPPVGGIVSDDAPSGRADWTIDGAPGAFTITNESESKALAVNASGNVVPVAPGQADSFAFDQTTGCAEYPEVDLNVTGAPTTGDPAYGEVSGLVEGHMHHMAFEFLGGKAHCGRPWHRFGAPYALKDCVDHEPNGCAAVLENALYGNPARCHDPVGWPTFADWPDPKSLTHEQSYYRWLERSWRGGLRVFVNLLVENRQLCEIYPLKQNDCNEMKSVELQAKRMQQLQDYIDAQSGGPGEGWFRIVRSPFEARRVINEGKLAVITGMEVSEPFNCRVIQINASTRVPQCDKADITHWLDRLRELGVRQLEIVNKFDNALTGVAGDNGTTGTIVNGGNFLATQSFWRLEDNCEDPDNHDHAPTSAPAPHNDDQIIANGIEQFGGVLPAYPAYDDPPLCNEIGLTALGRFAVQEIMKRKMVFDPDHMSVLARDEAMKIVEAERYSGVISSHSWSTENTLPRIYKLGGMITPYAGSSESFVHQWTHLQAVKDELGRQYYGVGYGADMNGFGSQGLPRGADVPNPVTYPFQSFDGNVTIDKQTSGQRVYDINADGVAHYGLYPDWIEDLRMIAGDQIVEDLGRGAEAYLQMWERADGIDRVRCGRWREHDFSAAGIGTRLPFGADTRATLEAAGQPQSRTSTWRWCSKRGEGTKTVAAVFGGADTSALLASEEPGNTADGVGPNDDAGDLRGGFATKLGDRLWTRPASSGRAFFYSTSAGRVELAGLTTRGIAADEARLRDLIDRAGVGVS